MNRLSFTCSVVALGLVVLPTWAVAQNYDPNQGPEPYYTSAPPPPYPSPNTPAPYSAQPIMAPAFTQIQLDQLLAPIALYPDALIGNILMAATYPLEIVEASRWRQSWGGGPVEPEQLQASLAPQPWDPSVKALVAFPELLNLMDQNLKWTEKLGEAFIAQQPDVMNSVQRLRQIAVSNGSLTSTPQTTVAQDGTYVTIQPNNPGVVFLPAYGPNVYGNAFYGAGPWPYQTVYYEGHGYSQYAVNTAPVLVYGPGLLVVSWLWGWHHLDWRHHDIDIDEDRYRVIDHDRSAAPQNGPWHFDPDHRHDVPFRNPVLRQEAAHHIGQDHWQNTRGYAGPIENHASVPVSLSAGHPFSARQVTTQAATPYQIKAASSLDYPAQHRGNYQATQPVPHIPNYPVATRQPAAVYQTASPRAQIQVQTQRASPPMFESLNNGHDARAHAERGNTSRATMPTNAQPQNQSRGNSAHAEQPHQSGHQDNPVRLNGAMERH